MTINKTKNGNELTVTPVGRLDTTTAGELEAVFKESLDGVESLVVDLKDLEYISSSGLRVLISAYKKMSAQGSMKIVSANEMIAEIFEVTGFAGILTIE